ncbi:protein zer-1 homolog isoform X2 [Corythoichthys intestinalis]|uniref:protein zer-1 homolog isoform X2 n=1 Tax=Corythoichthys intestinalis TaxID=161448 RepID=UPI0025A4E4A8|nr:protein zer-1 homolog isoform X2 [Corythoichthys intestinalis]
MAAGAEDDPDSLVTLATVCCLRNLRKTICSQRVTKKLCLNIGLFLPSHICDKFVNMYMELVHTDASFEMDESFLQLFSEPRRTSLTRLRLKVDFGFDKHLQAMRKQDLDELDLSYCYTLSSRSLKTLTCFRETLVSLCLFGCGHIFSSKSRTCRQGLGTDFNFQGFNRLRSLRLDGLPDEVRAETLLKPLKSITSLGLSNVELLETAFLTQWKDRLESLVLYNVDLSDDWENTVVELVNLNIEPCKSSIYPFRELRRPLQFLGLFDTNLCEVTHIPAYKVTGSKNEDQLLNAIEAYTEFHPVLAYIALNRIFLRLQTQEAVFPLCRAVPLLVAALKCHKYDKNIQVMGNSALKMLVCSADWERDCQSDLSVRLRQEIVRLILNGMEPYQDPEVQKCCLSVLVSWCPNKDLMLQYSRVNHMVLTLLESEWMDQERPPQSCQEWQQARVIPGKAARCCADLASLADNHHKEALGKIGFVQRMFNFLRKCMQREPWCIAFEPFWEALEHLTNESPYICQMFLDCQGVRLFMDLYRKFPSWKELHRNMMDVLINVVMVKALRPQHVTPQFINFLSNLLDREAHGMITSFFACGLLSHIMFGGPEHWAMKKPSRDTVMHKMRDAIQSWNVRRVDINYRSLKTIFTLLPQSTALISQHWATWALYYLVSVSPSRYCPLLIKEGGIELLKRVVELESSLPETKSVALVAIEQCESF